MKKCLDPLTPNAIIPFPSLRENSPPLPMVEGLINEIVLDVLKMTSYNLIGWKTYLLVSKSWNCEMQKAGKPLFVDKNNAILSLINQISKSLLFYPLRSPYNREFQDNVIKQLAEIKEMAARSEDSFILKYTQLENRFHKSMWEAFRFIYDPMNDDIIFLAFFSFTGVETSLDKRPIYPERKHELVRHLVTTKNWELAFVHANLNQKNPDQSIRELFEQVLVLDNGWQTAVEVICNTLCRKRQTVALNGLINASAYREDLFELKALQKWVDEVRGIINNIEHTCFSPLSESRATLFAQAIYLINILWCKTDCPISEEELKSFIISSCEICISPKQYESLICEKLISYFSADNTTDYVVDKFISLIDLCPSDFQMFKELAISLIFSIIPDNFHEDCVLTPEKWKLLCKLNAKAKSQIREIIYPWIVSGIPNSICFFRPLENITEFGNLLVELFKETPSVLYQALTHELKSVEENEKRKDWSDFAFKRAFNSAFKMIKAIAKLLHDRNEKETILEIIACCPYEEFRDTISEIRADLA